MKDIAIFEKNDIIGFEELYREIVIMKRYENETGKEINVNN